MIAIDAGSLAPRSPAGVVKAFRSSHGTLAAASLAVIVAGLLLHPLDAGWARVVWLAGLLGTGAPIVWRTVLETRRGRWATDVVAVLAIVGAVLLRQPVAGLVI